MDAGVYPWADVVDDGAIGQGFFDPFVAGVVNELEGDARFLESGVVYCLHVADLN